MAEAQRRGWWEQVLGRVDDLLAVKSARVWRYRFASATGVAVVVGLMWMGVRQTIDFANVASPAAGANPSLVFAETAISTPSAIAGSLPSWLQVTPADYEPVAADGAILTPASTRAGSPAPRYVLDRISVTPATYDVPNVQF